MVRFQILTAIVALAVCFTFPPKAQAQINWDPKCAIEAAQQFAECKAGGGRPFGCLVRAGFYYWQCSGSTIPASRLRLAVTGARAVRRAR